MAYTVVYSLPRLRGTYRRTIHRPWEDPFRVSADPWSSIGRCPTFGEQSRRRDPDHFPQLDREATRRIREYEEQEGTEQVHQILPGIITFAFFYQQPRLRHDVSSHQLFQLRMRHC